MPQATLQAPKARATEGGLGPIAPQEIFKIDHSETVSSASGTQELVSQARLEIQNKLKIIIIKNKQTPQILALPMHYRTWNEKWPASGLKQKLCN